MRRGHEQAREKVWKERESKNGGGPGFKGFLAHAHQGKDVPMSDADDLLTVAFASDADNADGG